MSRPLAVLVPTRSRPENVQTVVDAWNQTGAFGVAELYFVIDADDMEYINYDGIIRGLPGANMVVMPEWQPLVPKLNRAASEFADSHPIVVFMGDDHIPRTPMWAHMLHEDHLMRGLPPRIVYGQDGFHNQKLPTWWSMDSRIIKALGGKMVPANVQHLYCDNAIYELGTTADRLFYDERILIEHMHPLFGKGKMDAQYQRVNRRQQYERDGVAFHNWQVDGLQRDATLLRNVGG